MTQSALMHIGTHRDNPQSRGIIGGCLGYENFYYLFIALAMVAAMTVSCKNNKKAEKDAEANAEVVEAAKTILADDVLATLDEIAESFKNEENIVDVPSIIISSLTEQEKLIKPDYLLDAAQTSGMVTKSQKIGALAVHTFHKDDAIANEAEAVNIYSSIEKAKQHIIDSKDKFAARKSSEIIHNSITFFKAMPVNSGAAFSA